MFLYRSLFRYIHYGEPTWCMLTGMSKHEEYINNGFPLDAFEGIEREPWPPNWSEEEEAQYWHDKQEKYNEK